MKTPSGRARLAWVDAEIGQLALRICGDDKHGRRPVVMLHGWSQSSLSFARQFGGSLADRHLLLAPDLPGHGASPAPDHPDAASHSAYWADVVHGVILALGLERPVLVGWSMGGWIIGDYLRKHGTATLGGIVTVGTVARIGALADPAMMAKRKADVRAEGMFHDDPQVQIEAAIAFARALTAGPLSKQDLAFHVAQMMACPPAIRRAARLRDEDWRADFARARDAALPSLVIQGGAERVCFAPQAAETAAALGAETVTIPGAGHMPFWEQAERFEAAVGTFLDRC
ncbi:MAG: alpha/beta hydrolase [Pseudomonadota bacterium]